TWGQIISLVLLVFAAGGAYYQLGNLADSMHQIATSVSENAMAIRQIESRTAVLESQRVEDVRRLDEIRDDVRFIRSAFERQQ
ncbi:MAG TPA: hypothetical protein VIG24_12395, partial [Acidimicrobiia bacterium]